MCLFVSGGSASLAASSGTGATFLSVVLICPPGVLLPSSASRQLHREQVLVSCGRDPRGTPVVHWPDRQLARLQPRVPVPLAWGLDR